ncbi:MAG: cytochrome c [Caldimicrobium sp.]
MKEKKFYSVSFLLVFLLAGSIFYFKDSLLISANSFKCLKCHKGKDSLETYLNEGRFKTADELRKLVREGPKAGLHITSSDEDLERAIKYLNLK